MVMQTIDLVLAAIQSVRDARAERRFFGNGRRKFARLRRGCGLPTRAIFHDWVYLVSRAGAIKNQPATLGSAIVAATPPPKE